ncbi:hypothetical protein [Saccharomonospora sp.]|uniref:hypothetical protein n=1 Tax=Saccharomonospora sp. TaxID=33913 RepID=UPI00261D2B28|nr:hypothetical protein [Saccharomonospora sp.]
MLYIVLLLVLAALGLVVAALVTASSLWAWVSIVASGLAGMLLVVDWARRRLRNSTQKTGTPESADESKSDSGGKRGDGDSVDSADRVDSVDDGAVDRGGTGEAGSAKSAHSASTDRTVITATGSADTADTADKTDTATADESAGVTTSETEGGPELAEDVKAVSAKSSKSSQSSASSASSASAGIPETSDSVRTADAGTPPLSTREPVSIEGVDSLTDTAPRTALLASSGELAGADVDPPEENTGPEDALLVAELEAEVLVVDEYPRYHLADCTWLGPRATIPLAVKEARDLGFTPCALCGPDAALSANHRRRRLSRRSTA